MVPDAHVLEQAVVEVNHAPEDRARAAGFENDVRLQRCTAEATTAHTQQRANRCIAVRGDLCQHCITRRQHNLPRQHAQDPMRDWGTSVSAASRQARVRM